MTTLEGPTNGSYPYIWDFGISENKIWVTRENNVLSIYDGGAWQTDILPANVNAEYILVRNDYYAYISDGYNVWSYKYGTVDSIYTLANHGIEDWDIDPSGRAWIASGQVIRLDSSGNAAIFDTCSLPYISIMGNMTGIAVGSDSSIAACNYQIYRDNNQIWSDQGSYNVSYLTSDKTNGTFYWISGDSLYAMNNGVIISFYIGNMPFQDMKAISPGYIATPEGLFSYDATSNILAPTQYYDTSAYPFATDITCFEVQGTGSNTYNPTYSALFGTHHGVYTIYGPAINNALLPDTNINYIYSVDGSYYFGTDKGLCVYNQAVYTTFDTSNPSLPSDKITFVTSRQVYINNNYYTQLFIGTDKGLVILTNGQWSRFDTSSIHTSSFYVTGILPPGGYPLYIDSSIWVTTLGSGLVLLNFDSSYQIWNTSNGYMHDDTLYYAMSFAQCEAGFQQYIGTNSLGVAYTDPDYYTQVDSLIFNYESSGGYGPTTYFHHSALYTSSVSYEATTILVTDSGFFYSTPCGGIAEVKTFSKETLKWYEKGESLYVIMPDGFSGRANYTLYDMMGRNLGTTTNDLSNGERGNINIGNLSTGVYILQTNYNNMNVPTKVVISR